MSNAPRVQALVERLCSGDFAAVVAGFDDAMRAALPAEQLAAAWTSLLQGLGPFEEISRTDTAIHEGAEIEVATCKLATTSVLVRAVFPAGSANIGGLFFVALPPPISGEAPYVRAGAFDEQDISVGTGPLALPGTCSMPRRDSASTALLPAVVLVHGSGPNDRDETVGANRPFRDIAHGLASRGIAVLRYDKRTKVHPAQIVAMGTRLTVQEETVEDAVAAVQLARQIPGVDPARVFVVGHSLGGMVAPRIVSQAIESAGFVVIGGNARPLEDLVLEQHEYLLPLQAPPDVAASILAAIRAQVALVKSPELSPDTPASELPLSIPASYWLDLRGYDPPAAARATGKPVLVLQGERDYQVTMKDFDLWKQALFDRPGARSVLLPGLNHLGIAGEGPSRPEEYVRPGHVAEQLIDEVAAFVLRGSA